MNDKIQRVGMSLTESQNMVNIPRINKMVAYTELKDIVVYQKKHAGEVKVRHIWGVRTHLLQEEQESYSDGAYSD